MADDSMTETQRELWERIEEVRTAMMTRWSSTARCAAGRCGRRATSSTAACGSSPPTMEPSQTAHARAARWAELWRPRQGPLRVGLRSRRARPRQGEGRGDVNTFAQAWFPGGVDDPNLVLVRVDVEQAQYWEDKKPKVLQFAEIVIGAVTGNPPRAGTRRSSTSRSWPSTAYDRRHGRRRAS